MTRKEQLLQAAERLEAARELMNDKGRHWIKGNYRRKLRDKQGKTTSEYGYCSIGALNAVGAQGTEKKALAEVVSVRPFGTPTDRIIVFNDTGTTKWGDVSKAFRKAAARLRKEAEGL